MSSPLTRIVRSIKDKMRRKDEEIPDERKLRVLEKAIGYKFKSPRFLIDALVHRSYLPEGDADRDESRSNERKEFLGDAVLSLVVNHFLYKNYPQKSEGELTKMKSIIVSQQILSLHAKRFSLGSFILMSENAYKAGVDGADSVLADTLEAIFGAVFLDGGFEAASRCIETVLLSDLNEILYNEEHVNFKSLLQEYIQALHKTFPHYRVLSTSGPDHDKQFSVEVSVKGRVLGEGSGRTKKQAEQEAAREAYKKLLNTPGVQEENA